MSYRLAITPGNGGFSLDIDWGLSRNKNWGFATIGNFESCHLYSLYPILIRGRVLSLELNFGLTKLKVLGFGVFQVDIHGNFRKGPMQGYITGSRIVANKINFDYIGRFTLNSGIFRILVGPRCLPLSACR